MNQLLNRINKLYIFAFFGELSLGLTFIFYILLARILGPKEYGIFASAVALAGVLSLFIQLGLPDLLNREVAANPIKNSRFTVIFLLIEAFSSLLILLLLFPTAKILGFEQQGIIVCYLALILEVSRSAKLTLRSVFKGHNWFGAESVSVSLERFISIIFAIAALFITQNIIITLIVFVLARIVDLLGLFYWLNGKTNLWSTVNLSNIKEALRKTLPFAISGVLWVLYYQVDLLMLKAIAPVEEAGFYSAAYRIMEMFLSLPRVIFYVSFTKFTRCYTTQPDKLPEEIYKSTKLLTIFVLPVLVIAGLLEAIIIKTIYGLEFLPAVNSLAIILPSIVVMMFSYLLQYVLQAMGREKQLPSLLLKATVINIIINAILIPRYGAVGAAIGTLVTELILFFIITKLMRINYPKICVSLSQLMVVSLSIALVPSFLLNGLIPLVGFGLMVFGSAIVFWLIQPNRFLSETN